MAIRRHLKGGRVSLTSPHGFVGFPEMSTLVTFVLCNRARRCQPEDRKPNLPNGVSIMGICPSLVQWACSSEKEMLYEP